MIEGQKFSNFSERSFTFITNFNNMTYEFYLKQSKLMLERRLIQKLTRNPNLTHAFDITLSDPLIREVSNV